MDKLKNIANVFITLLITILLIKWIFKPNKEVSKIKEKTEAEKENRKLKIQKQKSFVQEFDNSPENPLSPSYKYKDFNKNVNRKIVGLYSKIAYQLNNELNKRDVNEEKVNNLFGQFPTRDLIHFFRNFYSEKNNSDWTALVNKAYKGFFDSHDDIYALYNTLKNIP